MGAGHCEEGMSRTLEIMMGTISISDRPPIPPNKIVQPARRVNPRPVHRINVPDLLEWEAVLRMTVPKRTATSGIYFLVQGNRIVYVGQSRNVHVRIDCHRRDKSKKFDGYAFVQCAPKMLNAVEANYIAKFRPKYNVMTNRGQLYMTGISQDSTEADCSRTKDSGNQQVPK
jgi:hypothetical protein